MIMKKSPSIAFSTVVNARTLFVKSFLISTHNVANIQKHS